MAEASKTAEGWPGLLADEEVRASLEGLARETLAWLDGQRLGALAPEKSVAAWIEALTEPARRTALVCGLARAVDEARTRLTADERTLEAALGARAAQAIRDLAEAWEPDEASIHRLVRGEAGERMMASVLYDGIMEFLRRADILGPLVDRIPVLGGLRRRILGGLKEEFERRAERQVRSFLETFSKAAVDRAVGFLVSEENRPLMRRARRKLADRLLARSLSDLAPPPPRHERIRRALQETLRGWLEDPARLEALAEDLRARFGEQTTGALRERYGLVEGGALLAPPLAALALRWLARPETQAWYAAHPLPPAAERPSGNRPTRRSDEDPSP